MKNTRKIYVLYRALTLTTPFIMSLLIYVRIKCFLLKGTEADDVRKFDDIVWPKWAVKWCMHCANMHVFIVQACMYALCQCGWFSTIKPHEYIFYELHLSTACIKPAPFYVVFRCNATIEFLNLNWNAIPDAWYQVRSLHIVWHQKQKSIS